MPEMYITRREVFSASHQLWNSNLTEQQNIDLFDKCANKHGHGHNYVIEVTVKGDVRGESGYVMDLKELKRIIRAEIISKVDHKHLNYDVDFMKDKIPTAENIVLAFWKILENKLSNVKLSAIRLHETENNIVEYRGEE